ncbi:MAG TPA: hypothetical protein VLB27_11990 [candidate division Zixibacteria bacterium]|nr:hypothetical protein [candidate division Zixibacteria bacterium]
MALTAIGDDAQARAARFIGSPSVRINGHDLEEDSDDEYSLRCRLYRSDDGLSGVPPGERVVKRLEEAMSRRGATGDTQ